MRLLRKYVFTSLLVVAVIAAAACGNGTGESANGRSPANSKGNAPKPASASNTFKHDFGSIEVSASPKRIIALYMEDYLVSLGITPVAQTVIGSFSLQYLQPHIGHLPKLDTSAIDFEAALEAQPDLILLVFPSYAGEGKYEKFSKVAPTYVFGSDAPEQWREVLLTVGKLTGREEKAKQVLADYESKANKAKQQLAQALGDETVALIRVRSDKELRLYGGPGGYAGNVLYKDLGLNPPEIVKKLAWGDNGSMAVISQEVIPELDADHLFITYDNGGQEKAQEIMGSSLWQSLPAVQKGQVYEVNLDHWMTYGPVAYNKKVDDVLQALVK